MTKTIELAHKAGLRFHMGVPHDKVKAELEAFEAVVRADERARLLAVAGEPVGDGYTQQFRTGDTPSLAEIKRVVVLTVPVYTADQVAAAVLREREECAKVCDEAQWDHAGAVRARSE